MGVPGSAPDVTRDEVRNLFSQLEHPSQPLAATTVVERLECSRRTAEQILEELTEFGELRSTEIDGGVRVWWRPADAGRSPSDETGRAEFRAFVNAVTDYAIFVLEPDGTVASWNDGAERIKGYRAEEIVGEHFSVFYTADDTEEGVPERNLDAAVTGGRTEDEGWRVRKDGSRFWANVTITAITDDDGVLQGFIKVTRDMTEQREYEHRLREERDLTEQILETVPVGIGVFDADGRLVRSNRRMLARDGLDESTDPSEYSFTSSVFYDAEGEPISPGELPWARVIETGDPVDKFHCQIELPDGTRQWLSIDAAPLDDGSDADRIVAVVDDISGQKERERRLERQKTELETELSDVLGRISDAFYALDDEWRFTHLNDRAVELMQLTRGAALGRKIWEMFPEAADVYRETFRRAMDTQEPVTFEVYVERLSAWLEFNVYPSESGLSIYFRDITERKDREQTLSKYEMIVETVDDGIYVKDDDGYFTMVNEAYAELTGYSREELVGAHASLVVDETTISRAKERKESLGGEDASDLALEAMIHTKDGDLVPSEATFAMLETEEGESEQIGVVRDITERKEYQRQIEESERRYRTLAENFPNGAVALFDDEFTYTAVGGQLLKTEGIDPDDRTGRSIFELYPEELVQRVKPYFDAALEGESTSFEVEYLGRQLSTHTLPVGTDDDIDVGMLVVQDVTERRTYQRELEESNERLEQFAYAASHDLQEPLRMVSSYLQLIEQRYADELDENGREFLEFAVDGAERMREMIDGLLQYSRVETRGDSFEQVDLVTVLSEACDDLQLQIGETHAEIVAESLPRVDGDRNQLRQLFQNLLSNAIEYSGDEPPRVEITVARDGPYWRISVSDNGIGIDPDDADRIFEIFQRLHSHDERTGTGIGLALCRRIVERHGGEIWVESEPGEGATFSFTLPVDEEFDQ